MYRFEGLDIEATGGDSLVFTVRFRGRALAAGSVAVFTVKKRARMKEAVIEKRYAVADNRVVVALEPADSALAPGTYWWDIRVLTPVGNGMEVRTPMAYAAFEILEAVGDG